MASQQKNNSNCTLWMGDLDAYMDEIFLRTSFVTALKFTDPSIVKSIRFNYYANDHSTNYCFVEFSSHDVAHHAQTRLNGVVIPGSMPSKVFKLEWSGESMVKTPKSKDFSVWVGDLESTVHDHALYEHFASRYHSVITANIVRESDGRSKGYGFVRFSDQTDQQRAIIELNNTQFNGFSIRVNLANPRGEKMQQPAANYRSPSYQSYSYTSQSKSYHKQPPPKYTCSSANSRDRDRRHVSQDVTTAVVTTYQEELEPPQLFDNPVQINREFNQSFGEMWSGLEKSRWHGSSYPNSYIKEPYEDGMIPLLY